MARYTFTVEGAGTFPLDMLRYDECWPSSSRDVENLFEHVNEVRGRRRIQLYGTHAPTVKRWESFLWSVLESRRV